jgi:hypothetical protein
MIKLIDILKEICDASSQPYSFDFYGDYGNMRVYGFVTENYPYTVELQYDDLDFYDEDTTNVLGVRFYISDEEEPDLERDDIVTNEGKLFKVMATVTAIIKKDLKNHPEIDTITFTPAKKEGETTNVSRLNLYTRYIKNAYPNATITSRDRSSIEVKFK